MQNPFLVSILSLLHQHPEGISEFEMLRSLQRLHPQLHDLAEEPNLRLFRQHFFIMNALYQLQVRFWQEDGLYLDILPTRIRVLSVPPTEATTTDIEVSGLAKLAAYYLDWQHYDSTGTKDVEDLLKRFYLGIHSPQERAWALSHLQLEEHASPQTIKQHYRRLAQQAHPDRGGSTAAFIELRRAFDILSR